MNKKTWMVGSYTTGATYYCNSEAEAEAMAHDPMYYNQDDPYVFIEKTLRPKCPYKYINTVTGEVTKNIWTAIRTTVRDYRNHKILTRWARYHG